MLFIWLLKHMRDHKIRYTATVLFFYHFFLLEHFSLSLVGEHYQMARDWLKSPRSQLLLTNPALLRLRHETHRRLVTISRTRHGHSYIQIRRRRRTWHPDSAGTVTVSITAAANYISAVSKYTPDHCRHLLPSLLAQRNGRGSH